MPETSQFYEYRGGVLVPVPIAASGGSGGGGSGASCDCLDQIRDANSEISQALSTRVNDAVTAKVESGELAAEVGAVPRDGNRGVIAGYQEYCGTFDPATDRISIDSPDYISLETSGAVTLRFDYGNKKHASVKIIYMHAKDATALTFENAFWPVGNDVPVWGNKNQFLILAVLVGYDMAIMNVICNSQTQ